MRCELEDVQYFNIKRHLYSACIGADGNRVNKLIDSNLAPRDNWKHFWFVYNNTHDISYIVTGVLDIIWCLSFTQYKANVSLQTLKYP